MKAKKYVVSLVVSVITLAFAAYCSQIPIMSIPEMTQKADFVLLVEVNDVLPTTEAHPHYTAYVKHAAHCIVVEIYKGRFSSAKIPPIDVAFFQHKPGILTSAEPQTLRKGENYILFLRRDHDDFVLITPFHGVIWTGGFRSSSHLIAAAEQVKQLFKVLEETRSPDKPTHSNNK